MRRSGRPGCEGEGMELSVRAVHLALERGIDGALLLDAVEAAKAFVDDFGGEMLAVVTIDADGGLLMEDELVSVYDADANLVSQEETIAIAIDE